MFYLRVCPSKNVNLFAISATSPRDNCRNSPQAIWSAWGLVCTCVCSWNVLQFSFCWKHSVWSLSFCFGPLCDSNGHFTEQHSRDLCSYWPQLRYHKSARLAPFRKSYLKQDGSGTARHETKTVFSAKRHVFSYPNKCKPDGMGSISPMVNFCNEMLQIDWHS